MPSNPEFRERLNAALASPQGQEIARRNWRISDKFQGGFLKQNAKKFEEVELPPKIIPHYDTKIEPSLKTATEEVKVSSEMEPIDVLTELETEQEYDHKSKWSSGNIGNEKNEYNDDVISTNCEPDADGRSEIEMEHSHDNDNESEVEDMEFEYDANLKRFLEENEKEQLELEQAKRIAASLTKKSKVKDSRLDEQENSFYMGLLGVMVAATFALLYQLILKY